MDAVVSQAEDRIANHIRSVEHYFAVRRRTIGVQPSLTICEIYLNIPDDIMKHPVIMKLLELCIDLILIGNDLYSYNVECVTSPFRSYRILVDSELPTEFLFFRQARGDDGHNLITVVMRQFEMDSVQSSIDWISRLHDDLVKQFMEEWQKIPTFGGPIDRELRTYCDGLGMWVHANEAWSFEVRLLLFFLHFETSTTDAVRVQSERYFGKEGLSIKTSRKVRKLPIMMLPKDTADLKNSVAQIN